MTCCAMMSPMVKRAAEVAHCVANGALRCRSLGKGVYRVLVEVGVGV